MDIIVKGARQHNLKNIDVRIPRGSLTVVTGLSGSGKSSLAFDTLYAEGQRRYVESLSAYARQFLDQMQKPEVDHIEGLPPAIAIEQRSAGSNPRSTVATTTEIYDYLRILYSRAGEPHCHLCGKTVQSQSAQAICDRLSAMQPGVKLTILAPCVRGRKGEHKDILEKIREDGFVRVRIDGVVSSLDSEVKLDKNKRHTIEAVVDRLKTGSADSSRLMDSIETALRRGQGMLTLLSERPDGIVSEELVSEGMSCADCGISLGEIEPRNFSFNSPYGACPECNGLGTKLVLNPALVIPDDSLAIRKGAIPAWRRGPRRLLIYYNHLLRCLADHFGHPEYLNTPWRDLPDDFKETLLNGSGETVIVFDYWGHGKLHELRKPFEGILPNLERRHNETESDSVRQRLRECMTRKRCPTCDGARLRPASLAVTLGGLPIHKLNALSVVDADAFLSTLALNPEKTRIASEVIREIRSRLGFLRDVGLHYLSLDRESATLSGGEAQRIRLATQVGSGLVGVLYVLDEPSIGLHQRDNDRLLSALKNLRDIGNTVVVVEHDLDTIRNADYVIDLGPGAGVHGGELVFAGTPDKLLRSKKSATGQFMSGERRVQTPKVRLKGNGKKIVVEGATHNNLKNIDVEFPLGLFCCVTGVSGSGKSSLVNDILKAALDRKFELVSAEPPGAHRRITGLENVDNAVVIDQAPIGRTPRSNPVTYIEAFGLIRDLYSKLPASKARGYKPGRFSFNVKGGRCEECGGDGVKKIEMMFLPDVFVNCSACAGRRFNKETLSISYKGKSVADVLDMTVEQAADFFQSIPPLHRKLKTLADVGMGYVHLGQPATTLSGGEAQRVKLATELCKSPRGHTLYILDEPTTGLHAADVEKLLHVLFMLRDQGGSILVIEHNLDVIRTADHVIDLGPEGGDAGGHLMATGTPEQVAKTPGSHTGAYLAKEFDILKVH